MKLKLTMIFTVGMFLFGCSFSFRSNQYETIRNLVSSISSNSKQQTKFSDWSLSWSDIETPVVPVNVVDQIWFVGEPRVVVRFDGWQIVQVENILPANITSYISVTDNLMTITADDFEVGKFVCSSWSLENLESSEMFIYRQSCSEGESNFENTILLDKDLNIIEISYNIHPGYPALNLRKNG